MKPIIIIGSGGHAKAVAEAVKLGDEYNIKGFVDSNPDRVGINIMGENVIAALEDIEEIKKEFSPYFVVAIGKNETRELIYIKLKDIGLKPATVIHPFASIAPSAKIGTGTVVLRSVVVGVDVKIGSNVILGTGCIIDHDCEVGDNTHIAVGTSLGGLCKIGNKVWIGIGASIAPSVVIADNSIVPVGTVIEKT